MGNILLIVYFMVILTLGGLSYKKIKSTADFYIANKESNTWEVTGSLLATILGSSAILGSVTTSYSLGWAGAWLLVCGAVGLTLLLPMLKYFRGFKGYNLPELMGTFYGKEVKIVASIIISVAWVGIVAAQIIGAAQISSVFTNLDYQSAVIITGLLFIIYTAIGGQYSVMKTDFLQLLLILFGLILAFAYLSGDAMNIKSAPELLNNKFGIFDLVVMFLTYSTTFFIGPDIYSRIFSAKSEKVARDSIIYSIAILLPLAFIVAGLGVTVAQLHPELDLTSNNPLLYVATHDLPKPISLLLFLGLLSAVISSADTSLLTASSLITQIINGDLKKSNSIKITRIGLLVIGIFAILVALKFKFILPTLLLALSIYSGALIIPCLLGLLGYRVRKPYVLSAIVLGGSIAAYGKLYGGSASNFILIGAFLINLVVITLPKIVEFIRK